MTIYSLVGKKNGKWESIAVGEDYKSYKDRFMALTEKNEGFEAIVLLDGNQGILKRKFMTPDKEVEAPKSFKKGH